jgi:adenine phosphoribosyltransferase
MTVPEDPSLENFTRLIRDIPDFPKKGIIFKDITPLLRNGPVFHAAIDRLAAMCEVAALRPDALVCPEARGFIFGSALAYRLGVGVVPVRKPNKLPHQTTSVEYALEYGSDLVEMHVDAVQNSETVILVDDLIATGGTMSACAELVLSSGAKILGCVFLIELDFLQGRRKLARYPVLSLIHY